MVEMAGAFVDCGALRDDELGAQQAAINKTGYTPGAHSHQALEAPAFRRH